MNYVDHLNLFGEDVKEIPTIKGIGAPHTETIGEVGCLYIDLDTGDIYKCTSVSEIGTFTWMPTTPLHYNSVVTLSHVSYDELFRWQGIEGNHYRNSFSTASFSRTPNVGDIFSLIFTDKKQNKVYSFAQIVSPPNDQGFTPFEIKHAVLLYNAEEAATIKSAVEGLKTEKWTFLVQNTDGTTTPITKNVVIK